MSGRRGVHVAEDQSPTALENKIIKSLCSKDGKELQEVGDGGTRPGNDRAVFTTDEPGATNKKANDEGMKPNRSPLWKPTSVQTLVDDKAMYVWLRSLVNFKSTPPRQAVQKSAQLTLVAHGARGHGTSPHRCELTCRQHDYFKLKMRYVNEEDCNDNYRVYRAYMSVLNGMSIAAFQRYMTTYPAKTVLNDIAWTGKMLEHIELQKILPRPVCTHRKTRIPKLEALADLPYQYHSWHSQQQPGRMVNTSEWCIKIQELARRLYNEQGPEYTGHLHICNIPFGCADPETWLKLQDKRAHYERFVEKLDSRRSLTRGTRRGEAELRNRTLCAIDVCQHQQCRCQELFTDISQSYVGPKNLRTPRYGATLRFKRPRAR